MCVEIVGAVEAITFQPFEERNVNFRRRRSVPFFPFFLIIGRTIHFLGSDTPYDTANRRFANVSVHNFERNRMSPIMFRFLSCFYFVQQEQETPCDKRGPIESPFNVVNAFKTYDTQT